MTQYPPGPTPSRQEIVKFARNPLAYFMELTQYGEFVYTKLANRETYLVTSPALLREIMVERADKFEKTSHTRDTTSKFLGEGMLNAPAVVHRRHRRTIQPVFSATWVESYAQSMVEDVRHALRTWQHGEQRDIARDMMGLTLNIVGRTIFGVPYLSTDAAFDRATWVMQQYSNDTLTRSKLVTITEQDVHEAVGVFHHLVEQVLSQHQRTEGRDLISMMRAARDPESGQPMSDREIRDEALTLLMAGHETTANAVAWTLYLIAKHPEVEERLRTELDGVLDGREIRVADLGNLPYLERVLKEALRVYPPAWLLGRAAIEPVEIGGYSIQPDANIIISPYVIHRNPRYFDDPETFNPDRFLVEPTRYSYLPFGAGPRVCIGQPYALLEMAIITATLMGSYHLTLPADYVAEPEAMLTLRPKGGLPMRVTALEKAFA